jgi:uncharacterized protein (TIGR02246 family)
MMRSHAPQLRMPFAARLTHGFLVLIALVLATAAVTQTAAAQTKEEQAVRAASDKWQRDAASQNVDAIVALHTPDAVLMLSHAPLLKGSDAIRAGWTDLVKTPGLKLSWTPTKIEVASPTVATEYGTYTESYDTPQGKATDAGNYVTIWHKINGKWRVALDAPNTTAPLPAAMPADAMEMSSSTATALTWSDFSPAGFPPGAKIAVLHGNPAAPGRVVLRLSLPDGYQVPLHWHPGAENVTVLSGTFQLGSGNTVDMAGAHNYGAGDYVYVPPRQPHFAQAHGATVLQVAGNGPFVLNLGVPK